MKNFCLRILAIFCMFLIIFPSTLKVNADSVGINNHTLLVKDISKTQSMVQELKNIDSHLEIDHIDELGIIYINNIQKYEINNLYKKLGESFKSNIEEEGELPKNVPHSIKLDSNISPETINQAAKSLSNLNENFDIFKWYIKDVTSDYKAHSIEKGSENVKIALIDSGVDQNHPDIQNKLDLSKAKSYVTGEETTKDDVGHGTSVAGVIKSISPETSIVPYKVIGSNDGESYWTIQAIVDAAKNHYDIINLSLGTYKTKNNKEDRAIIKSYKRAINFANKAGSLVVASAGNEGHNLDQLKNDSKQLHLPGGMENVITVSSSVKSDSFSSYSNFGKNISFSAPGGDYGVDYNTTKQFDIREMILTTYPIEKENTQLDQMLGIPQGYTLSLGTSLSAPQVSATAALIISKYEKEHGVKPTKKQVLNFLRKGAIDPGAPNRDIYFGYGKINAYNSLMNMN